MVSERRIFGERLKRQRERRGVRLETISEGTKIATSLFVGLENGDCSRWPSGLYSRAYVRAYAEAIGLNADETVEDFAALFGDKVSPDGTGPARRRRPGATLRLGLAEEPPTAPLLVARRVAVAGGDLVVASSLAIATHLLLDPGIWITAGTALAYHAAGRVLSDEPLVLWLYRRLKTPLPQTAGAEMLTDEPVPQEDVPVGSAASTAA